jgi:predicted MFS family arabinose efflux permease
MIPAMETDLASRRWLILASTVVSFLAVGVTFFAVPPLASELVGRFGLSHFAIGVLMGAIGVPAIVLSIPLGAAVDRWPARAAGNFSLALMLVGAVLFALAPSYAVLLIGRIVFGLGGLIVNLLLARLVTTAFAGRELSLAMGVFNAVYPASMILMFTFHPRLLASFGWRGELTVLAVMVLIAIPLHNLAVPRGLRGEAATHDRTHEAWVTAPLLALACAWMLFFAAYASVFTFAPEWTGAGSSALLIGSLIAWVAIVLSPLAGGLIDRTGRPARWLFGGQLLLAGVLAAMSAAIIPPIVAMLLVGVTFATVSTSTYSMPAVIVAPARVGFAFGFITAFSNLGNLIGPAVAGALRDQIEGWTVVWAVLAGAAVVGAVAALWLPVTGNRGAAPSE